MGAGTGTMSVSLMCEETSFMESNFPCSTSTQFQIAAYQALLASLLSPCCHRPPYLAQGLTVFRNGKSNSTYMLVQRSYFVFISLGVFCFMCTMFLLCTGSPLCILSRCLLAPDNLLKKLGCYLMLVYWMMVLNVCPIQMHISHIWASCVSVDHLRHHHLGRFLPERRISYRMTCYKWCRAKGSRNWGSCSLCTGSFGTGAPNSPP